MRTKLVPRDSKEDATPFLKKDPSPRGQALAKLSPARPAWSFLNKTSAQHFSAAAEMPQEAVNTRREPHASIKLKGSQK